MEGRAVHNSCTPAVVEALGSGIGENDRTCRGIERYARDTPDIALSSKCRREQSESSSINQASGGE
jgi:hypothetical protein